jgi:ABC-type multidrug transport system fused ATPase/permease subunit
MDINELVALANERITCGPECRKDRQTEELRKIYDRSKQELIDAPMNFVKAEKNYLLYSKGENEFNNIMKERTLKTLNDMKKKLSEKHTQFVNDIRVLLNQYNTEYIYSNRINDLYKNVLKENKKYKQDISDFTSNMNMNNRKVFYESEDMESMGFTRIVLLIIYFITLIAILYKIEFIGKELYRSKPVMFVLVVYILIGVFTDWITVFIYNMSVKIIRLFENDVPKNVYVNI